MRYYLEYKMNHSNTFSLSFPEAKTIIVSGDIHGDFNQLVFKLCIQYKLTDTLLIVAGDCGFGFEKKEYYEQMVRRNTKRMNQANNWIVFVRGNHDNPAYFEGTTMDMILHHLKTDNHPVSHWYYGHFHQSWHSAIDEILYQMLNIMEFSQVY